MKDWAEEIVLIWVAMLSGMVALSVPLAVLLGVVLLIYRLT